MHGRLISLIVIMLLLMGCDGSRSAPNRASSQLSVRDYTPFRTALAAPSGTIISTAGYYYTDGSGAILADSLSFSGEQPAPLADQLARQVWLADTAIPDSENGVRTSGAIHYAPLLVTGRLEGPGAYGPDGRYAFQLSSPSVSVLVPVVLTVTALLDKAFSYDGQFVRVQGTLLANGDSALLLDRLEAGGVPPRASRQLKLADPVRDTQLLQRLRASASGSAHYGDVEIEGFWRAGQLVPLGIIPGKSSP